MKKEHSYFVYILASKRNGTLYTGVTNNLLRRIIEHKDKIIKGFSSKYGVDRLVYYEIHTYINDAIKRESNIKAWNRKKKLELIETYNIEWKDLFYELADENEIEEMRRMIKERYNANGMTGALKD